MAELRKLVLNWATDNRPPGKHVSSAFRKYWPAQLPQTAKFLPLNLNMRWFAAPGHSTCAMGAAAALMVGTAVVGTAHAAHEPAGLQRTTVVSELPAETPAEPEPEPAEQSGGEAASDGQGSTTPLEAPAEPEQPPASVPLDELRVTSPFGWRENPLLANGALEFHNGIDFGAVTGTPVKAAAAGTVTYAEYHQYGGLRIVVDHGNGTETTYNHLSAIGVEVGQWVDFNTVIGAIGSTGNSTGPHLHFEVLINGEYQDPAVWLGL